ncbi:Transcriptional regulator NRG1 [Paramyrothecium foliicola]|nr:Transcriptional regulator NRG1 [Paramyrothecium foliicola]
MTQLLQPMLQSPEPQSIPATPAPEPLPLPLPDASTTQDLLQILPDEPALGSLAVPGLFDNLPSVPRSEASNDKSSSVSPETSDPAWTSGQDIFAGLAGDQEPNMVIGGATSFPLFPRTDDDASSEAATNGDIMANAVELSSVMGNFNGLSFTDSYPPLSFDRLYCPMPWPDDMLASPERRFLWQYFLSMAEDFLCLDWEDVGHYYGFQNPYIVTLPHMALTNDALRGAVFCFAASQYQLRHGRPDFERTKGLTGSEAAVALSRQMAQGTDDNGLLSMISAATLLHYFGPQRHDYLRVASQMVGLFLARGKSRKDGLNSFPEVPLTEFRWSVISTLCSLQQPSTPLGDQVCRHIEMGEDEIKQKYSRAFQSWVSHPIYTFSPRLVNPLLRIGRLLERQLLQLEDADVQPDLSWTTRVSEAEEMLLHARECDVNASKSSLGTADPAAVLALNESMYAAGAILLYARIHGLPPTAPFIRKQTQIVTDEIMKIPANSRVSFAIVFPLFIAGCEAVEQQMRNTIVERLRDPKGVTYERGDLVGALSHIWDIRDLDPGLPWPHWVSKGTFPLFSLTRIFMLTDAS